MIILKSVKDKEDRFSQQISEVIMKIDSHASLPDLLAEMTNFLRAVGYSISQKEYLALQSDEELFEKSHTVTSDVILDNFTDRQEQDELFAD